MLIAALLLVCSDGALAQAEPPPAPLDPRIELVAYDANQIVPLRITAGFQVMVEFAADERIENVALGDSSGWQATPNKRGDRLFVKSDGGSTTNMTVVTDARTYLFELGSSAGDTPLYTLRFSYPQAEPDPAASGAGAVVGRYKLAGVGEIRPDAMHDDGQKTYLAWRADQPMPAIFVIDARGQETLANGAMRQGYYVVDGIANRFVFRLDEKAASATRIPKVDR
jgi:type IV secretion system protein VirB9